jgi:hypothetical protein
MSTWMLYSKRCSIAISSNNTVISIWEVLLWSLSVWILMQD